MLIISVTRILEAEEKGKIGQNQYLKIYLPRNFPN